MVFDTVMALVKEAKRDNVVTKRAAMRDDEKPETDIAVWMSERENEWWVDLINVQRGRRITVVGGMDHGIQTLDTHQELNTNRSTPWQLTSLRKSETRLPGGGEKGSLMNNSLEHGGARSIRSIMDSSQAGYVGTWV